MFISMLSKIVRAGMLLCPAVLFSLCVSAQEAQLTLPQPVAVSSPQPDSVISLAARTRPRATFAQGESSFENAPANFRAFDSARVGEDAGVEPLTLNFSSSATLGKIASTSKQFCN